MLFSHISDTHLGLVQYGSEEREQDVYDAFNQSIDIDMFSLRHADSSFLGEGGGRGRGRGHYGRKWKKNRQNSHLIIRFLTSEGVSEVSERANE